MNVGNYMSWGVNHPRKLFQIDAIGALISAFLLDIVLTKFTVFFGIPISTLYFLALFPCLFVMFDLTIIMLWKKEFGIPLRIIAFMNMSYCLLSIGVIFLDFKQVTLFGWCYIVGEILIVFSLGLLQLNVAKKMVS